MPPGRGPAPVPARHGALTAEAVLHAVAAAMPADALVAEEAPSHRTAIQRYVPIRQPRSFFTMASGGLGYALPAAVGVALASPGRRVVALIGDGSMMYSIQALYTAAQWRLPVTVVVLNNRGYGAMRAFSQAMGLGGAPGIDLPDLDFAALAAGHGCGGARVETAEDFEAAFDHALRADGPWVIDALVDPAFGELYAAKPA
jgi:benzoylformate decarboxylase